jgi:hypothetical protein
MRDVLEVLALFAAALGFLWWGLLLPVVGLLYHGAYHAGQMGAVRRSIRHTAPDGREYRLPFFRIEGEHPAFPCPTELPTSGVECC